MVAQHYRWDFYGLSTDSKPTADNPKVANGSTFYEADTSKLYVWYTDQWYEKEAGGSYELPIASAETLGGVKVGEGLAIDEGGVLSASGGGGGIVTLTADDFNYPENNPDGVAMWLLPPGIYQFKGIKFYLCTSRYDFDGSPSTIIINPYVAEGNVGLWSLSSGQYQGLQITNTSGTDYGFYTFTLS